MIFLRGSFIVNRSVFFSLIKKKMLLLVQVCDWQLLDLPLWNESLSREIKQQQEV